MTWNLKSCGPDGRRYLYLWDPELKKKVYVGRGVDAEQRDRERTETRISKLQSNAARGALLDRIEAAERPVRDLFEAATALLRATLVAAGYTLHARSEWRHGRRKHGRVEAQ